MYTVIWTENGSDHWDRFERKEDVDSQLEQLKNNPEVCLGDIWIFPPQADEYAVAGDEWNSSI